jgi:NAD(P)-dependent dehydrogenase (short-subunit alcohol dehydrogenase family)
MPANPYPELSAAIEGWRYQPPAGALQGRVILITGAGDGIGAAAARTCAHFGANVVLLGRTQAKLEAVSDAIVAASDTDPTIVPCDLELATPAHFHELNDSIIGHYGRLDALLHNASSLGARVPFEHYDPDIWRSVMRVNVDAAADLTRALLPALRLATAPSIVFTSSSVGRKARAYWGAYAVSKFAVEGLMQLLADEFEHEGIRVNSINPGATRTAMRASAYPAEDPRTVATPESRLDVYLYLLGPDSRGTSGMALDARDWSPPGR